MLQLIRLGTSQLTCHQARAVRLGRASACCCARSTWVQPPCYRLPGQTSIVAHGRSAIGGCQSPGFGCLGLLWSVGNVESLRRRAPAAIVAIGDLAVPGTVDDLIGRLKPTAVINLIGYGVDRDERDPAAARRLNAELPEEIGRALLRDESS